MRDALGRVKTVAIVGGTSDIGLAVAQELSDAGTDRFLLAGRDPDRLGEAASSLRGKATTSFLDVSDTSSHVPAVENLFADGDVDVVVIAAGYLAVDATVEDAIEMAQVNYEGAVSIMLRVAESMRRQGHGQIVIMSSAGVTRPRPSNYLYGASKAAIDFAARGLMGELSGSGVTVTIVRPGFVKTKMTQGMSPSPLSSSAHEVAKAVADAVAKQQPGVVWVPSVIRVLAWALGVLPGSLVRRLDR